MIQDFKQVNNGILDLMAEWEPRLLSFNEQDISEKRNGQNRSIRQIIGHMVDSASNNTHRIIHLQYNKLPVQFPNYATEGNNDRWIAIQDYEHEDWAQLVGLWKYIHLHFLHVVKNIKPETLNNQWNSNSEYGLVSLKEMVVDFLSHFELHIGQINELIEQ